MVDESGNTWSSSFNLTVEATKAFLTYNAYSVNSDNNGDDLINKGETIKLNVSLRNDGTSTVKGLKTTFTTTSDYVTGFTSTANLNYGDISPGYTSWFGYGQTSYNVIQFTVKTTTPDNTIIPINVSMVDESGNTWSSSFDLVVKSQKQNLLFSNLENNKLDYEIFPNPTENNLYIRVQTDKKCKINVRLTDLTGKTLLSLNDINPLIYNQIDVSSLSKGKYLINIFSESIQITDKFIVK